MRAFDLCGEGVLVAACRLPDGTRLCDYASAGNCFTPENLLRVWLPKR